MSQSGREGSNVSPESPRGQHTKVSGRDQRLQETGVQQGTAIRWQQRPSPPSGHREGQKEFQDHASRTLGSGMTIDNIFPFFILCKEYILECMCNTVTT